MKGKGATYFQVKVRELFPPSDPIVPPLLRLMAAINDLMTLQKLWVYAKTRVAESRSEEEIIKAEHICLFRFTCGVVYEAGRVFEHFRRVFVQKGTQVMREMMPDDAIAAFHALDNTFPKDFEKNTRYGIVLIELRNSIFHYAKPGEFRRALLDHDEMGSFIHGDILAGSRYLLVDDLQAQITMHPLDIDKEDNFRELGRLIVNVMDYLVKLADGTVAAYLYQHQGAVVEEREDTVDPERLWRIPIPDK